MEMLLKKIPFLVFLCLLFSLKASAQNNFCPINLLDCTHLGSQIYNGPMTASGSSTISNTCSIERMIYVSTAGCYTTIEQALTATSCRGTIVLPPGFTETANADVFKGWHSGTCLLTIYWPSTAVLTTNATQIIPGAVVIHGEYGAQIQAGPSFPSTGTLVQLGDVAPFSDGAQLLNVSLVCNPTPCQIGLFADVANEDSGWDHLRINGPTRYGIIVQSDATGNASDFWAFNTYVVMGTGAGASSYGIVMQGISNFTYQAAFKRVTVTSNSSTALAACMSISNASGVYVTDFHMEQCTDGVYVTNTNGDVFSTLVGATNVGNLIHISNSGGPVTETRFEGLTGLGDTNSTILDSVNGNKITDNWISSYDLNATGAVATTTTTNSSVKQNLENLTILNQFKPGTFTVSTLPLAASNPGVIAYVTDSTSISTEGQTCVGGSSNKALAFSNGSVWKCF